MSDIVERLLRVANAGRKEDGRDIPLTVLLDQSADEITALRARAEAAEAERDRLRGAVYRFLSDYDDSDRADAGNGPLMELHIAEFRAALANKGRE